MVNFVGIAVPKIVVLLSIWIPSYDSNTKMILTLLCALKLIWDYDRSRPSHMGLIYKLTSKARIEVQELVVSAICLVLSVLFAVASIKYTAWIPVGCGVLSVAISLFELVSDLKDMRN